MRSPDAVTEALGRLRDSGRPHLLFVSHAFGGGVLRHIEELAACVADAADVLLLRPIVRSDAVSLSSLAGPGVALWFDKSAEWARLVECLRAVRIDRVHFHHVHGLPPEVLELPARLACGHDVTLHDFFPACPEYHLLDGQGRHCGGAAGCQRCGESRPVPWGLTIDAWRARFGAFLAGAQRVIAPSHDCAQRIATFFPAVRPVVWPHAEAPAPTGPAPVRVLVPGAISPAKGVDVLEACVRDAAARALPLHFRVLGYVSRPTEAWPAAPLSLAGEYPEGRLPALLAQERGDVVFFPAQCPETFSYTLSDALATGLPVVATDLGALPERLAGRAGARVLPWALPAAQVNDALLSCARPPAQAPAAPVARVDFAQYRARYLEGIEAGRPASTALPAIEARWTEAPPAEPAPWTLAALFDDGVRCGRASSLELLRRRCAEADVRAGEWDAWIEQARAQLAAQEARIAGLESEARAQRAAAEREAARAASAEERVADIERSRSWRLTAPLRALRRSRPRRA